MPTRGRGGQGAGAIGKETANMRRATWRILILGLAAAGCASKSPGARPHDMSAAAHEHETRAHAGTVDAHEGQYNPNAHIEHERCQGRAGGAARAERDTGPICWTSVNNPTTTHLRQAEDHRRHAANHRAASAALRDAEERACAGVSSDDRDMSPFEHVEDITNVEPLIEQTGTGKQPSQRTAGAIVTFRAVPGMTAKWLQQAIGCHLARNASLGHVVPEMPDCPLVPNGAQARVTSTGNGFAVAIRSDDAAAAQEILLRAQRLRTAAAPANSAAPTQ
ncbi:MAG: hypothetical protein GMKNLPBB_03099 [Myxococcota bacterium]|nr:hypothetical protein [Myxococcota bacterium]